MSHCQPCIHSINQNFRQAWNMTVIRKFTEEETIAVLNGNYLKIQIFISDSYKVNFVIHSCHAQSNYSGRSKVNSLLIVYIVCIVLCDCIMM